MHEASRDRLQLWVINCGLQAVQNQIPDLRYKEHQNPAGGAVSKPAKIEIVCHRHQKSDRVRFRGLENPVINRKYGDKTEKFLPKRSRLATPKQLVAKP